MGYAFTFPFVRLVTGGECVIGSYTHYPTVSSDMANRVRNQAFGVESRSGPKSWLQTQLKLM
jgi:alpha-1,2-mannosyltransferase